MAKHKRLDKSDGRSPKKKSGANDSWMKKKPKAGKEDVVMEVDGRNWNWCKYHKKCVLTNSCKFGEHSSKTCKLNPKNEKNKKKKSSPEVRLDANAASMDDNSDSADSNASSSSSDSSEGDDDNS